MKLAELHADLKMQERDELSLKKLKAEGLDQDGEKEASLVRNLNGAPQLSGWGWGSCVASVSLASN